MHAEARADEENQTDSVENMQSSVVLFASGTSAEAKHLRLP